MFAITLYFNVQWVTAQKYYLSSNIGYAIPVAGYTYGGAIEDKAGLISSSSHRKGPNTGFNLGLELGRRYTNNVSFYLAVNYLYGTNQKSLVSETTISNFTVNKFTADFKANSIRILPGIKIMASGKSVRPYVKFGAGVYVKNQLTVEMAGANNQGAVYLLAKQTNEYTCKVNFGLVNGIGIDFKLKKASLFLESSLYFQNLNYKSRTITALTIGGVDQLNTLSVSEKEREFSKNYNYYNANNKNEPTKSPAVSVPFSHLSFNAGFLFPF